MIAFVKINIKHDIKVQRFTETHHLQAYTECLSQGSMTGCRKFFFVWAFIFRETESTKVNFRISIRSRSSFRCKKLKSIQLTVKRNFSLLYNRQPCKENSQVWIEFLVSLGMTLLSRGLVTPSFNRWFSVVIDYSRAVYEKWILTRWLVGRRSKN